MLYQQRCHTADLGLKKRQTKPAPWESNPAGAKAGMLISAKLVLVYGQVSLPAAAKMPEYPANLRIRPPSADHRPRRAAAVPSACPRWRSRSVPSAIEDVPRAWSAA